MEPGIVFKIAISQGRRIDSVTGLIAKPIHDLLVDPVEHAGDFKVSFF